MKISSEERPFLIPCLSLAAGLAMADSCGVSLPLSAMAALFFCLLLSCCIRHHLPLTICIFLFFLSWGMCALPLWTRPPAASNTIRNYAGRDVLTLEGVICSRPVISTTPTGSSSGFILETTGIVRNGRPEPVSGRVMMYVRSGETTLSRGDLIRLATRISVPHRLGLPGEFDFARFLAFQGVDATGSVASVDDIVLMRGAVRDVLMAGIDREARQLGDVIRASLPDVRVSSVVTALLIGDQKRIPKDLSDAYARAGVNHILSISGFHVGIIAFFMVQTLLLITTRFEWLALRFNLRRAVLLPALPAMLAYLLLTGSAPATARSVVMLGVFVVALYVERESDPVNALLMSAMLLLALNPTSLFDLSFQLSFLALWGMVVAVPPVMAYVDKRIRHGWLRSLLQFVASSCAASAVTAVPVLFIFNQASFTGILSNFLIVPLLGYGAVVTGFCALLFSLLHIPLAYPLLWTAGKLVLFSNWLITWFAGLPLLRFGGITRLDMLAFLAFMCLATFMRPGRRKIALCSVMPLLAVSVHIAAPPLADGRLHITMLSVGQAESALIRLPEGSTLLVDGGGYLYDNGHDFGERILGPALFKLGVRRIDYMVMTHSHPDHNGGLSFVARTMPVGEFWEAPGGNGQVYEQLKSALAVRKVPMRQLTAGDTVSLPGGVTLRALSPPRSIARLAEKGDEMDMNETSLVFRLTFGEKSFLFTGDAGFDAEERMLKDRAVMAADVLKVGHHGSRYSTSEDFLDRVAPRIALISAGRGNGFGLPSSRTLSLLHRRGVVTYRTDLDGTIEVISDGRSLVIATPYRP